MNRYDRNVRYSLMLIICTNYNLLCVLFFCYCNILKDIKTKVKNILFVSNANNQQDMTHSYFFPVLNKHA